MIRKRRKNGLSLCKAGYFSDLVKVLNPFLGHVRGFVLFEVVWFGLVCFCWLCGFCRNCWLLHPI